MQDLEPEPDMRSTPSRFTAFAVPTELGFEGAPTCAPCAPDAPRARDADESVLERHYPAVVRAIMLLWGYPELNQYFAKIWSGQDPTLVLAPDAMAEAMLLSSVHQRICPFGPAKSVADLYGPGRWSDTWKAARPRL
jgi:hypothetical protein